MAKKVFVFYQIAVTIAQNFFVPFLKTQYKLIIIVSPTLHWSYEEKGQQGVVSSAGSYDKLLTHTLQVSNCYYIEKIVKTIFFNLFLWIFMYTSLFVPIGILIISKCSSCTMEYCRSLQ